MLQIKLLYLYKINVGNYSFHIDNDRQEAICTMWSEKIAKKMYAVWRFGY